MDFIATVGEELLKWIGVISGLIALCASAKAYIYVPKDIEDLKKEDIELKDKIRVLEQSQKDGINQMTVTMRQDGIDREGRIKIELTRLETKIDVATTSQQRDHDVLNSIKTTLDIIRTDILKGNN